MPRKSSVKADVLISDECTEAVADLLAKEMYRVPDNVIENDDTTNKLSTEFSNQNSEESGEQAQFYIEVDADSVVNLQAGTQYTLIPFEENSIMQDNVSDEMVNIPSETPGELESVESIFESIENNNENVSIESPSTSSTVSDENIYPSKNNYLIPKSESLNEFEMNSRGKTYTSLTTTTQPLIVTCETETLQHRQIPNVYPMPPSLSGPMNMHHPDYHYGNYVVPHPMPQSCWPRQHRPQWVSCPRNFNPNHMHNNQGPIAPNNTNYSVNNKENQDPNQSASTSSSSLENREQYKTIGNNDMNLRVPLGLQQQNPMPEVPNFQFYHPYNDRENHNEKERKRRSRIKTACQAFRALIPGISDKTDKATVFEYAVQYFIHIKQHIGMKYDKEFVEKYSPY